MTAKPPTFELDVARLEALIGTLDPGEDFGITHRKNCREKLAADQEGREAFPGPGRCPACGSKADLRLPGAERIAVGMGCMIGRPEVAQDLMDAVAGVEYAWIAFRLEIIHLETGQVIGHGVGARALSESSGNTNTMFKMGKKSAVIDGIKTTFGLSGRFTQDVPHETERTDPPAAAETGATGGGVRPGGSPSPQPPRPAPSPPQAPAPHPGPAGPPAGLEVSRKSGANGEAAVDHPIARMLLDGAWDFYALPKPKRRALYEHAGWREGQSAQAYSGTVHALLNGDLHKWVLTQNITSKMVMGSHNSPRLRPNRPRGQGHHAMEIDFSVVPDGQNYLRSGKYYAVITDCEYDRSKHEDWGYKLTLTAAAGPDAGKTVIDRVWASWEGDPQHALVSRLKILARETGLLKDPKGKATITPEALMGRELWVTVVEGKPYISKKTGKEVTPHQVDFAGYEAAHQRPSDFAEQAVKTPAAPATPANAAPSPGGPGEPPPF
jgi:hypothetical protein